MVREVHPLTRVRLAPDPAALRAAEQPGEPDDEPGHRRVHQSARGGWRGHRTPSPALIRKVRMMRRSRTAIVSRQPSTTTRQVQSRMVNPPGWTRPDPHHHAAQVVQAPACKDTIRHGLAMTPLYSRCAPTAWPSMPTYAVRSAKIAAQ